MCQVNKPRLPPQALSAKLRGVQSLAVHEESSGHTRTPNPEPLKTYLSQSGKHGPNPLPLHHKTQTLNPKP